MIKSYSLSKLVHEMELVPQAIISSDIYHLSKRYGWKLEEGRDDFDEFLGTAFLIRQTARPSVPREVPFAIMRYKGHPSATSTIYLPFEIQDLLTISKLTSAIIRELDLSERLVWQRKDGLEALKA